MQCKSNCSVRWIYLCPLSVVIKTGIDAIAKHAYPGLETVVFCGFTIQEQTTIRHLVEQGL